MKNRITASISIWAKEIRPDKISEVLQFVPDDFGVKGIQHFPPRPRPTHYGWHVSNREYDQVLAGEVLDRLVARVEPIANRMPLLLELDNSIYVDFHLLIAPKSADLFLYIEKKTISFMASMRGNFNCEFFDL
jgi:hypothetical protein